MPNQGNKPVCIRLTPSAIAFWQGLAGVEVGPRAKVKIKSKKITSEDSPERPGGIGVKGGVAQVVRGEILDRMRSMGWDDGMGEREAKRLGRKILDKELYGLAKKA